MVDALRAAYQAEIERFAEQLRPRFEAGELHWIRDSAESEAAMYRLVELVREHFGLAESEDHSGDTPRAHLVLALSAWAEETDEGGWWHPASHAAEAAAWDVLTVARRRGWYVVPPDESPHPAHLWKGCPWCSSSATEVRS